MYDKYDQLLEGMYNCCRWWHMHHVIDHVLYNTCVGIRTSCVQLLYRLKLSRMRTNVIITWYNVFGRLLAAVVIVISICPMIANKFITSVWIGCRKNFEFIIMSECMVVIWHTIFTYMGIQLPEFWIVPSPPIFLCLKTSIFNLPLITTVCFRGFRTSTSAALMSMHKSVSTVGSDSFRRSCAVSLLICNKTCFLSQRTWWWWSVKLDRHLIFLGRCMSIGSTSNSPRLFSCCVTWCRYRGEILFLTDLIVFVVVRFLLCNVFIKSPTRKYRLQLIWIKKISVNEYQALNCLYYVYNYFWNCSIFKKIFVYMYIRENPKQKINYSFRKSLIQVLLNYKMTFKNPMFHRKMHKSDTIWKAQA